MSPDEKNSQKSATQQNSPVTTFSAYKNNVELSSALLSEIYEKFGIIVSCLKDSNIFDSSLGNVHVFDIPIEGSKFSLCRTTDSKLQFTLLSTKTGIRVASLKLPPPTSALGIIVTWSDEAVDLFAGDFTKLPLSCARAQKQAGRVRQDKNGAFIVMAEMLYHSEMEGRELLALSTAKELWDVTVFNLKLLVEKAKKCVELNGARSYDDFLLEKSISQQCFIMLVRGFEVYTRERFLEIEKELPFRGIIPQFDLLLNEFTTDAKTLHRVFAYAEINQKSILEASVSIPRYRGQKGLINFQSWSNCKEAYNLCYNIKFGEIPNLKSDVLERMQRYMRFRHKIIHSSQEATMLHAENPKQELMFLSFDVAESAIKDFADFIEKLHIQTENVTTLCEDSSSNDKQINTHR
jgi:hypothetical protein